MVVVRRRLIFWLIKAYVKKSGKTLFLSFVAGLAIFFLLLFGFRYVTKFFPTYKRTVVGLVGAYTQDQLPPIILNKLSRGITKVESDGTIQPDLASSWQINKGGKEYVFHLKKGQYFSDGKPMTSAILSYNFADVSIDRPGPYEIVFHLKDPYAPFLVTASQPVFEGGFTGTGDYTIHDISLNGNFVQSLTLVDTKNRFESIRYQFYASEDVLKMAFLLGEVTQAVGITDPRYNSTYLAKFPNASVKKQTDYSQLVALFFKYNDSELSDQKLRLALSYALPDNFALGETAYLPYSPQSIYYNSDLTARKQDFVHAKLLIQASGRNKLPNLTIKTLEKYKPIADKIAHAWTNLGVQTTIEETDTVPATFQIFLGDFTLPKDPDQYTLWHSDQVNNITHYKNLRIDKLLEDGRKTIIVTDRKQLYDDFQKYLVDDAPAAFLYFPYEYTITRK